MAQPSPFSSNPVIQRLRADGHLVAPQPVNPGGAISPSGISSNFQPSSWATSQNPASSPSIQQQNEQANGTGMFAAGMPAGSVSAPAAGQESIPSPNARNGGLFGLGLPKTEQSAIQQMSPQVQLAGQISGLDSQRQMALFQQKLADAGIHQGNMTDPTTQKAIQGIYSTVFGGQPQTGGPISAFAPTGLRGRAMAAGGSPVWGQGDVVANATPNAQGGTNFGLSQVTPVPGQTLTPPNPITQPLSPFSGQAGAPPNAYQQNAQAFQQGAIGPQRALAAAFAPGVKDPVAEYVANGGQDTKMLTALNSIHTKRAESAALQTAYPGATTDSAAQTSAAVPSAGGTPDPIADAQSHLTNYIQGGGANQAVITGLSKQVEQAKSHASIMQQMGESHNALLDTVAQANQLIDNTTSGLAGGRTQSFNQKAQDLHAILGTLGSQQMMGAIQAMKAASQNNSTGLGRILQSEAQAMSDQIGKFSFNHGDPQLQSPAALKTGLTNLVYHSTRGKLALSGIDPESRTFATPEAAAKAAAAGKIKAGDEIFVGKTPGTWSD